MLYLVGLGLGNVEDITVKGLNIVKSCNRVYLEAYTSILTVGKQSLEEFYGRSIILADREMVEQNSDEILKDADTENVAFLVVGDPFGATTHSDLVLRAVERDIPYKVIHNASILNAIGCCGLQLYSFGETVSIVFWTDDWKPNSFFDKISKNREMGLHTLCLLDIKVKEQTIENLMKGNKIYEPPHYMTCATAAQQLIDVITLKSQDHLKLSLSEDSLCVGLARIGTDTQSIAVTTLTNMAATDLGDPLHSLVIPSHMHPLEAEMLKLFALDETTRNLLADIR